MTWLFRALALPCWNESRNARLGLRDTLWDLLLDRTRSAPDALMLVDDRDRTISFAEFVVKAERVAAGLYARGVREGSAVSWQLPTRIETVLVSMALSRLGTVQNPVSRRTSLCGA